MALVSYAFLSIDEVQRHLKLAAPTAAELAVVEQLTNGVTDAIEEEIGRQVVARNFTETLDGTGTEFIQASLFPIQSVSALVALDGSGATVYTYDHSTVALTRSGRIQLRDGAVFARGVGNISITYSAGWGAAAAAPNDLKMAALQWIARLYRDWSTDREPIASQSVGGVSTVYLNEAIPKFVAEKLARYATPGGSAA